MSLPDIFRAAIEHDSYVKGNCDFSTTQILKPPQETWLASRHSKYAKGDFPKKEDDLYKGFMSFLGTGVHRALELAAGENEISEVRFYHTFNIRGKDWTLGGMMDWGDDIAGSTRTEDYKLTTTSSFTITGGEAKDEHMWQGFINSWLANQNGHNFKEAAVLYIFRDWSYSRASYDPKYPQEPWKYFTFPLPAPELIEARIVKLMTEHVIAMEGNPRPCTDEERWSKPDTWALKKPANKRARKVCTSRDEASANVKAGEEIEHRPGEKTKCRAWCFGEFCPQCKGMKGMKGLPISWKGLYGT